MGDGCPRADVPVLSHPGHPCCYFSYTGGLQLGSVPGGPVLLGHQLCCLDMTPPSMWTSKVFDALLFSTCWPPGSTSLSHLLPEPKGQDLTDMPVSSDADNTHLLIKTKKGHGSKNINKQKSTGFDHTQKVWKCNFQRLLTALRNLGSGGRIFSCWAFIPAASWQPLSTGWRIFSILNLRLFAL